MDEIFSDITLATLAKLPADRPVSLVVRHAPRVAIHSYNEVYVAGLTPEGIAAAVDFGARLAQMRTLRRIVSSPVSRCVNTALAVARGAAWQQFVRVDDRISHPFISPVWLSLSTLHYPVTPVPAELAAIVRMLTAAPGGPGTLDLYITHDTIVGSLAGYFAGQPMNDGGIPNYLEGVFVWMAGQEIKVLWRDKQISINNGVLTGLAIT